MFRRRVGEAGRLLPIMAIMTIQEASLYSMERLRLSERLLRHKVGAKVMIMKKTPKEISLGKASEMLGISYEAARQLTCTGTLPHVRRNFRIWVRASHVRELIKDKEWRENQSRRQGRGKS